ATIANLQVYATEQLGELKANRALGNLQRLGGSGPNGRPGMDAAISGPFAISVALLQTLNQALVRCWHFSSFATRLSPNWLLAWPAQVRIVRAAGQESGLAPWVRGVGPATPACREGVG